MTQGRGSFRGQFGRGNSINSYTRNRPEIDRRRGSEGITDSMEDPLHATRSNRLGTSYNRRDSTRITGEVFALIEPLGGTWSVTVITIATWDIMRGSPSRPATIAALASVLIIAP